MRIHSNGKVLFFNGILFMMSRDSKIVKLSMDVSKTSLHRKCESFTNKLLLHLLLQPNAMYDLFHSMHNICDLMAYDFYFLHPLAAETASAQINIIVKPRDSNNVLPEENTNEFSIPAHNGWQPDYEKNLIKSQDNNRVYGHVVKHGQDDYSYGAVTPNSWSDDKLHMRFNEVSTKEITL